MKYSIVKIGVRISKAFCWSVRYYLYTCQPITRYVTLDETSVGQDSRFVAMIGW